VGGFGCGCVGCLYVCGDEAVIVAGWMGVDVGVGLVGNMGADVDQPSCGVGVSKGRWVSIGGSGRMSVHACVHM
jgi:hypothetical protein